MLACLLERFWVQNQVEQDARKADGRGVRPCTDVGDAGAEDIHHSKPFWLLPVHTQDLSQEAVVISSPNSFVVTSALHSLLNTLSCEFGQI